MDVVVMDVVVMDVLVLDFLVMDVITIDGTADPMILAQEAVESIINYHE